MRLPIFSLAIPLLTVLLSLSPAEARNAQYQKGGANYGGKSSPPTFKPNAQIPSETRNSPFTAPPDFHKAAQHAREAARIAAEQAQAAAHNTGTGGYRNPDGRPPGLQPTSTYTKQYPRKTNKPGNPDEDDDLYYFFTLHDRNADYHLDGHELMRAFVDAEGDGSDMDGDGKIEEPKRHLTLAEVQNMVDHVIGEDDLDNDGMISWEEYLLSQQHADD
ncbi:hypothetical protein HK097_004004 [Rhizophlyctis rosea]|uniref:EF-hand domain-containing protein n=1 Tax=Rhizophlyctis rosea TaxID=64517 RepID=A0AAD5SMD9_9FUNG|nr:hypothetical protein HK097_004004 [Rhizophlyctis rosea]